MQFVDDKIFIEKYVKQNNFIENELQIIEGNTNKKFGTLLKCGYLDRIRILLSENGFSIWFPPEIYRHYDIQATNYLNTTESKIDMWIAKGDYYFVKIFCDKADLENDKKQYMDDDLEIRMEIIKNFVIKNFISNYQIYPDSDYFTIGSYLDCPQTSRPFRWRLGGNYKIEF